MPARVSLSTKQPITLVIDNSSSNGPRPLSYTFEVAADTNFTTKVFTREGISPGSGRTSLRLPDALATGRTYFWRSQAQDGANASGFSSPVSFSVFTPRRHRRARSDFSGNNTKVSSPRPTFTWANAATTGPAGNIIYEIEVADNDAFAARFAGWVVDETSRSDERATAFRRSARQVALLARAGLIRRTSGPGPKLERSKCRTYRLPVAAVEEAAVPSRAVPAAPPARDPGSIGGVCSSVKARVLAAGINLNHGPGECGRFEVTKRVAWELRADGVGLMAKVGSQNGCSATNTTNEPKYGVDVVMYRDGTFADILCGGGDGNTPCWGTGTTDPSLWRQPFNPD